MTLAERLISVSRSDDHAERKLLLSRRIGSKPFEVQLRELETFVTVCEDLIEQVYEDKYKNVQGEMLADTDLFRRLKKLIHSPTIH